MFRRNFYCFQKFKLGKQPLKTVYNILVDHDVPEVVRYVYSPFFLRTATKQSRLGAGVQEGQFKCDNSQKQSDNIGYVIPTDVVRAFLG